MKIIKNNIRNRNTQLGNDIDTLSVYCSECGSELEITKSDMHIGWLGAVYVNCPCCGRESAVDELDGITLTAENIKFPKHFIRTNKDLRHVRAVDDTEIERAIKCGINYFRESKDDFLWYTSYGDLLLFVLRYPGDKEYTVFVTKDFYETSIPFEKEDYE